MLEVFHSPWIYLSGFLGASLLIISLLNHLEHKGFEGTVIGTLIMPYCSGAPNIIFAILMISKNGPGGEVFVNAMVNNMTNLSLLIGLPCIFWGLDVLPQRKTQSKARKKSFTRGRLNRLSLSLTLLAAMIFTAATFALGRDRVLTMSDGAVLVGLFLFWQCFGIIEVMKSNVQKNRKFGFWLMLDVSGLAVLVALMFYCGNWLVDWLSTVKSGFISYRYIGWLSGWFMVLPNAIPAFYYGAKKRADIVYSSQIGDGHICIPLCIGLFAIFHPIKITPFFRLGLLLLLGMTAFHLFSIIVLGRLPRVIGVVLVALYGYFLYRGLVSI